MSRNDGVLGINVVHGRLALTLMKGGVVRKSEWIDIPDNIVDGEKIVSQNLFADFLKELIRTKSIKCKKAAYVIPDSEIFVKNITMPEIADEQLRLNIPFEFRDLISVELNQYVFDFIKRKKQDNNEESKTVSLLAYAVPIKFISEIRDTLRMAGLKLVKALPETSVYETMIGALGIEEEVQKERCFMDIGRRAIRMMIFRNGEFKISHLINIGEEHIINAIADAYNVDSHLATTYLRTKYQDCDQSDAAINAYKDISVEILKGLNFYELSDMSSRLKNVVLCGTGAMMEPLVKILVERIDKEVVTMDQLFPKYNMQKEINVTYGSVGILLSDAVGVAENSNFAEAGEKEKTSIVTVLATAGVIVVALGLLGKFGVIDRMRLLEEERRSAEELQTQIEQQVGMLDGYEELTNEYGHYSWEQLSDEEKRRVSRLEAMLLCDLIGNQGMKVKFLDLSGEVLTVDLMASDLDSVNRLSKVLEEEEIVEGCTVLSAKTNTEEEADGVTAQIRVYLTNGISKEVNDQ